jgi:hypothetical protein
MGLPAVGSTEWNEVASAHMYEFLKSDPRDQYFKKRPTLAHLRSKQMTKDGGDRWAWPILDGSAPVGRSYIGVQGHTPQDVKVSTMAETVPFFHAEPIFIAHTDGVKAGGGGKLFDLLETKTKHTKLRLTQAHSAYIWATSKATSTDPDSIPLAIPVDPTLSVAFNNLNGASGNQTYWRNKTQTSSGSWSTSTTGKLDALLNDIAEEAGDPSLLVTTKTVYGFIQAQARGHYALHADVKSAAGKQMADLGIPMLNWNGIPIIHDADCPSGKIYALNDDAIQWVAVAGGDYTIMEPGFQSTSINGVMGSLAWMRLEGALCVWERRALGQVDGTSAA